MIRTNVEEKKNWNWFRQAIGISNFNLWWEVIYSLKRSFTRAAWFEVDCFGHFLRRRLISDCFALWAVDPLMSQFPVASTHTKSLNAHRKMIRRRLLLSKKFINCATSQYCYFCLHADIGSWADELLGWSSLGSWIKSYMTMKMTTSKWKTANTRNKKNKTIMKCRRVEVKKNNKNWCGNKRSLHAFE